MKKTIFSALILAALLSLCSCGGDGKDTTNATTNAPATNAATNAVTNAVTAAETKAPETLAGSGTTAGSGNTVPDMVSGALSDMESMVPGKN